MDVLAFDAAKTQILAFAPFTPGGPWPRAAPARFRFAHLDPA
jgi:hypothetical protein